MIEIVNEHLLDTEANFIVNQVSCADSMGKGHIGQVAEQYPHIVNEHLKYIRYCKKNKIDPNGTVQYIPNEIWALVMVDTMKNDNVIDYDKNYQYLVNMFCQGGTADDGHIDLKAMKKALVDVRDKAQKIGAKVAIPYRIGCHKGGANWDDIYTIIKKVFEKSDVNVEILKF